MWIGWAAAIPLLIWTISGLWMVARPIEEVRGAHLTAQAPAIALPPTLVPPRVDGRAVAGVRIEPIAGAPAWVVAFADGGAGAARLDTGDWLRRPGRDGAIAAARAHLLRPARVADVTYSPADAPPIDLRRPRPAWRVQFADGVRVYVDADTGGVLALRTRQWRLFDLMWGLHILAPREREDTSHAVLIAAAAAGLAAVLLGAVLLPWARRRRLGN